MNIRCQLADKVMAEVIITGDVTARGIEMLIRYLELTREALGRSPDKPPYGPEADPLDVAEEG